MSGRIRFANQLRGLAALSVASSHLIAIYWALPDVVSWATYTPPHSGKPPWFTVLVSNAWFNPGPFGVAVFFLISGLVIPFSLEKHTWSGFLAARLLRIFPTYVAALLLECLLLRWAAAAYGRPFGVSPLMLTTNLLLVYDLVGQNSMDLINWSLSVELKFYLLAALALPLIRRGSAAGLLAIAACILAGNVSLGLGVIGSLAAAPSSPTHTLSAHSLAIVYMLIGTAFNFHIRRLVSTAGLLALVAALVAIFIATWRFGILRDQYPVVTLNYAYALILFGLLYALRKHVPANPVLDAMAAISFPFYVLHSLVGYLLLRVMMVSLHASYSLALPATIILVIFFAWALHIFVERPSTRAGRLLGQRPPRRSPHGDVQEISPAASHPSIVRARSAAMTLVEARHAPGWPCVGERQHD